MNFISKNLNKAQSLVTKLEFVTKDFKAQFQYPAHAPKVFRVFFFFNRALVETLFKALVPYFVKKKKKNLTIVVDLPSSRLSSHRHHWAPTVVDEAPLRANHRRLSSMATLRIPLNQRPFDFPATLRIPLNRRPFAFPATVRLPSNRRPFVTKSSISSWWPFAFLPSGPLSLSLSLNFFNFFWFWFFCLLTQEKSDLCVSLSPPTFTDREISFFFFFF